MDALGRRSRPIVIGSLLLLAIVGWHRAAIGGQLTATWVDSSANELGFSVERSTGTTGTFGEIGITGPGVTAYTDASVGNATAYCYRVRAYNATAYSDYSNVACGATAQASGLAVVKTGAGSGVVISAPSGVICGASCSGTFASGTAVTLTATPATGSAFTGWSGAGCSGTGTCTVTLTGPATVTATFGLQSATLLQIGKSGSGHGTVTSVPAGINCGASCSASYANDTVVTLTATPSSDSTFAGWNGGGCSGSGICSVKVNAAATVTATFATPSGLEVRRSGSGSGRITSTPPGITCGVICAASYRSGAVVALTAAPYMGSMFAGWSGDGCSGTGPCNVKVSAATTVTATFAVQPGLEVRKSGSGTGRITSTPPGIACGVICAASYPSGAVVALTAAPYMGSTFAGWSGGGCSGTGPCNVKVSAATTVTATFTVPPSLEVDMNGSGTGTVTSTPAGIGCGEGCSASYPSGTVVMLTAAPDPGFTFTGWSGGGCTGTGSCAVSLTAGTTVTATFDLDIASEEASATGQ